MVKSRVKLVALYYSKKYFKFLTNFFYIFVFLISVNSQSELISNFDGRVNNVVASSLMTTNLVIAQTHECVVVNTLGHEMNEIPKVDVVEKMECVVSFWKKLVWHVTYVDVGWAYLFASLFLIFQGPNCKITMTVQLGYFLS